MAWLLRDGNVLATLEVAEGHRGRSRGLLGRDGIEGAILLDPARSVHTIGMRFPIDVAVCDADMVVLRVRTLPRWRVTLPVRGGRCAIETEAGLMAHWDLKPGDQLEVRE